MNAVYRRVQGEPEVVSRLCDSSRIRPFWGADSEVILLSLFPPVSHPQDSVTPLPDVLATSNRNLEGCFRGTITTPTITLKSKRLAKPIKRVPGPLNLSLPHSLVSHCSGLALPSTTHFKNGSPIPLHLLDFVEHVFHLWNVPGMVTNTQHPT